jgi:hypothetical protein
MTETRGAIGNGPGVARKPRVLLDGLKKIKQMKALRIKELFQNVCARLVKKTKEKSANARPESRVRLPKPTKRPGLQKGMPIATVDIQVPAYWSVKEHVEDFSQGHCLVHNPVRVHVSSHGALRPCDGKHRRLGADGSATVLAHEAAVGRSFDNGQDLLQAVHDRGRCQELLPSGVVEWQVARHPIRKAYGIADIVGISD